MKHCAQNNTVSAKECILRILQSILHCPKETTDSGPGLMYQTIYKYSQFEELLLYILWINFAQSSQLLESV